MAKATKKASAPKKVKDHAATYVKYKCQRKDGNFSKKEDKEVIREFKRLPHDFVEIENSKFASTGFWYEAK